MNRILILALISILVINFTNHALALALTANYSGSGHTGGHHVCGVGAYDPQLCLTISGCSFCIQDEFSHGPRCNSHDRLAHNGCEDENILDTFVPELLIVPDESSTITIPILPNSKSGIKVTWPIAQAPMDLYVLIEFTSSMYGQLFNIKPAMGNLPNLLDAHSTNWALGFGTFADKPVSPFGYPGYDYAFINRFKLKPSATSEEVLAAINPIPGASGVDNPDDIFDGLAQTALCQNDIGWRDGANHLVIAVTNSPYHQAGDGVAAGITTPFDDQCHLDPDTGRYTEEVTMDYPSIAQIQSIADTKNIVFAVTPDQLTVYQELSAQIPNSYVAPLTDLADNLDDVVVEALAKVQGKFELVHDNSIPEGVTLKFFTDCNDGSGTPMETTICNNLGAGPTLEFKVEIEVGECPEGETGIWRPEPPVNLYPLGLPNYSGVLDIVVLCETQAPPCKLEKGCGGH